MPQAPARRAAGGSSDVAKLVGLHHRRRGWAWVAVGSAIGLVVYVGIDVNLFKNLTGKAETLGVIPAFVLLALVLAGLVAVIADTSRIHRADAAVRVSAKGRVSHYPLYAHAHRYPPHHHGSWVFAIVMLVVMTGIAVFLLPAQVNSWAYAVGAENHDTFNPVSYGQACGGSVSHGGGGCRTVTEGYLSKSGAHVTWGTPVPLGQPFSVREPLWAWGTGRTLTNGDGSAIPTIVAGLFFDGVALLLLYVLVVIMRGTSSRRSSAEVRARLARIRAEPAEHIFPIAVIAEVAFVAVLAVSEVGADTEPALACFAAGSVRRRRSRLPHVVSIRRNSSSSTRRPRRWRCRRSDPGKRGRRHRTRWPRRRTFPRCPAGTGKPRRHYQVPRRSCRPLRSCGCRPQAVNWRHPHRR